MKPAIPDNLEQLISQMLDGELPADQQVDLTRELLRNPAARRVHDGYVERDRQAAQALRWLLDHADQTVVTPTGKWTRRSRSDWSHWVTSGWAVAAAVLLMAGLWATIELSARKTSTGVRLPGMVLNGRTSTGAASLSSSQPVNIDMEAGWCETASVVQPSDFEDPRPLIETPTTDKRSVHRKVLGIIDEIDDCFYYLEMEHQTSKLQRIEEEL